MTNSIDLNCHTDMTGYRLWTRCLVLGFGIIFCNKSHAEVGAAVSDNNTQQNQIGDNIIADQVMKVVINLNSTAINKLLGSGVNVDDTMLRQQAVLIIGSLAKQYGVAIVVEAEGEDPEKSLEQALADVVAGNLSKAHSIFERARARAIVTGATVDPSGAKAAYGLSLLAERESEYAVAQERIEEAMRWDPANSLYRVYATRLSAFAEGPNSAFRPERQYDPSSAEKLDPAQRSTLHRWLGDAYQDIFLFDQALSEYKKAIEDDEGSMINEKTDPLGYSAQNIASLYTRMFDYIEAERWFRVAWNIQIGAAIPGIDIAALRNNLGQFYLSAGCITAAERNSEAVILSRARTIPEGHPFLAFALNTYGMTQIIEGRPALGIQKIAEASDIIVRTLGLAHWRAAQYKINLAEALMMNSEYGEALSQIDRAERILSNLERPPQLENLRVLVVKARLAVVEHQWTAAETFLADARNRVDLLPLPLKGQGQWRVNLAEAELSATRGNIDSARAKILSALELDRGTLLAILIRERLLYSDLRSFADDPEIGSKVKASFAARAPLCQTSLMP